MRLLSLTPFFVMSALLLGTAASAAASPTDLIASATRDRSLRDLGELPANSLMNLAISLPYRHGDELERLVEAQANPDSPLYRRFLTTSQFNAYFAPGVEDYARVTAAFRAAGFDVRLYENRTLIDASAPARTVERFFSTDIHRVAQPGYGVRIANVADAFVPAALRASISGVTGLENVDRFHTFNHFSPNRSPVRPGPIPQLAVPGRLFGPDFGYGPTAFIDAYDLPSRQATGKGQVVANVIDADFLNSDLSAYLKYFGVYRDGRTVRVKIDGGPPPGLGSGDSVETTLDVETLASLAPGAALYVYEFPDFTNNQYILDAYERVVIDDYAGAVNSSFGGCEIGPNAGAGYPQMTDQIALQGAALGITFHASTGDDGNVAFGCSSTSVSSPASSPHFVAIGGTSLYLNPTSGAVRHEYGWGGLGQFGATGGGVSSVFRLPSYQRSVRGVSKTGRNIPDVSFDADPGTGESFYYGGAFQGPIGGTSLSSPIYGAAQTLLDQLAGSRAGFINPKYYGAFVKYGYRDGSTPLFRDVVTGNNGFYAAHSGYDQMTGIGAPIIGNLHPFVR